MRLISFALRNNGVCQVLGEFHIVARLHGELAAALRPRAEVGRIAEHLGKRNEAVDLLRAVALCEARDVAAPGGDIADDVAHILVGDNDTDLHDGFENDGIRLLAGLLERHGTGDLERKLRRVDLVIGAVVQRDLYVDHGEAGQNARFHRAANALLDRRNEFLRDRAADGGVDELEALAALVGFDGDLDMAVLALAAGLTRVFRLLIDLLANGLFIGDLRRATFASTLNSRSRRSTMISR